MINQNKLLDLNYYLYDLDSIEKFPWNQKILIKSLSNYYSISKSDTDIRNYVFLVGVVILQI